MFNKKRTCLLPVRMVSVISKYVNHHYSWCSYFICYNSENESMNGNQQVITTSELISLWLFAKVTGIFPRVVEVYARSPIIDVHHERLDPVATFSSMLTPAHLYKNISILQYENDNSFKLIIGTFVFSALVTSSLRLDKPSELETGPSTTMFTPSRNTKIFIPKTSRDAVNDIIQTKKETLYPYDILHQLRQLRSKMCSPSTYLISRSSAIITNQLACRPFTVFTIVDSANSSTETDEMIACMVLRLIATKVMNKTTTLTKPEIENIVELKQGDTVILKTVQAISALIKENDVISILHNNELESLLNILANTITSKLPTYNEQVKIKFKQRMQMLKEAH